MEFRKPTHEEWHLLEELASIAKIENLDVWLETLWVREMDDGGMGSLELMTPTSSDTGCDKHTVICKAAVQFTDTDGVEVIASLNAYEGNLPFELDIWKIDFSKLIHIPYEFRRMEAEPL